MSLILRLAMGPEARLGTMYEQHLYPSRTHRRAFMAHKQREPLVYPCATLWARVALSSLPGRALCG